MAGGAYSALSGMQARLADLDRLAADLANVGTAGYKTERDAKFAAERDRFSAALDSAVDVTPSESKIDFRAGSLASTGRDLDVAIQGNGFFVVETETGPRYTRNGSFTRQADGTLATMDGHPVLGEGGSPITLTTGAVTIAEDGTVRSGAAVAGKLQIVDFAEGQLERDSGARFRAVDGAAPTDLEGRVVSGALEQSNVSVVDRMVALTEINRGFEALQRGVSVLYNDIDSRAISELGRAR